MKTLWTILTLLCLACGPQPQPAPTPTPAPTSFSSEAGQVTVDAQGLVRAESKHWDGVIEYSLPPGTQPSEALLPRLGASGPEQAWIGGTLRKVDLEGGFWQIEADQKYTLADPAPPDLRDGAPVIALGRLSPEQVGISQAGPHYEVTRFKTWKP